MDGILAVIDKRKDDPDRDNFDEENVQGDMLNRLVMAWSKMDKNSLTRQDVVCGLH